MTQVLDRLFFQVRVLCFKYVLLTSKMEIQNNLFFQVLKQLVACLVRLIYTFVDRRVPGLELVQCCRLLHQIVHIEKELSFVRRVLDCLFKNYYSIYLPVYARGI